MSTETKRLDRSQGQALTTAGPGVDNPPGSSTTVTYTIQRLESCNDNIPEEIYEVSPREFHVPKLGEPYRVALVNAPGGGLRTTRVIAAQEWGSAEPDVLRFLTMNSLYEIRAHRSVEETS